MKHERPCLVASGSDWLQEVLRRLLVWVVVLFSGTMMAYAGNLDISQAKVITCLLYTSPIPRYQDRYRRPS